MLRDGEKVHIRRRPGAHGDYIRPFSMPFQYMRGRP
ncbi:hypothetical protein GGP72_002161 [Salinibacter ruber]|uniref:Uncharacterized protein n=1 Tax=Salinibacter ruber TaxID=146919 RepID=A0A9X2TC63_9BACT|nr:hypothetical protein [Salinibacter ruber]MCS3681518.1 hypothetical protein [Salinibacter ruber]